MAASDLRPAAAALSDQPLVLYHLGVAEAGAGNTEAALEALSGDVAQLDGDTEALFERLRAKRKELAAISNAMDGVYGKGKYCPRRLAGKCLTLGQMSETMAKSLEGVSA